MTMPVEEQIISLDHQEKYNRTPEDLLKANMRMAGKVDPRIVEEKSLDECPEPAPEIIEQNGIKLHKRTDEDYECIKETFLRETEPEFKSIMGYGKEEIEKIGWRKFIDAYDWPDAASVFSWKTDAIHIIPCVHCGNEFANFEMDMGLCLGCSELYDLEFFSDVADNSVALLNEQTIRGGGEQISIGKAMTSSVVEFAYDEEFRKKFLKTELDKRDQERSSNNKELLQNKWQPEGKEV